MAWEHSRREIYTAPLQQMTLNTCGNHGMNSTVMENKVSDGSEDFVISLSEPWNKCLLTSDRAATGLLSVTRF